MSGRLTKTVGEVGPKAVSEVCGAQRQRLKLAAAEVTRALEHRELQRAVRVIEAGDKLAVVHARQEIRGDTAWTVLVRGLTEKDESAGVDAQTGLQQGLKRCKFVQRAGARVEGAARGSPDVRPIRQPALAHEEQTTLLVKDQDACPQDDVRAEIGAKALGRVQSVLGH